MACELGAGACPPSERPIRDRCVPSGYRNRGTPAGEVLAVRAQVDLVVGNTVSTPPPTSTNP